MLNTHGFACQNAIYNTLLAYPLLYIGEALLRHKLFINNITYLYILIAIAISSAILIIFCSMSNGAVWIYKGKFGDNIFFFLAGGIGGTLLVFSLSILLLSKRFSVIETISDGAIIILPFHMCMVKSTLHFNTGYYSYMEVALILLLFVPVINAIKLRAPIILGYRGKLLPHPEYIYKQ